MDRGFFRFDAVRSLFVTLFFLLQISACQSSDTASDKASNGSGTLALAVQSASKAESVKSYRSIHVFVALCDNINQGIVPAPAKLGNGQDPANNLYWGALYGVKTHFKKDDNWVLIKRYECDSPHILERILFKHKEQDSYMLADAYDGAKIKACNINMIKAINGEVETTVELDNLELSFGSKADLVAYIGHNGLMDFNLELRESRAQERKVEVILLACASSQFYGPHLKIAGAYPLLWTTNLMAPEAYVLQAALASWLADEEHEVTIEAAAQAYHKYQKCGINGARNLFKTGY